MKIKMSLEEIDEGQCMFTVTQEGFPTLAIYFGKNHTITDMEESIGGIVRDILQRNEEFKRNPC